MSDLTQILSTARLTALKASFSSAVMNTALEDALPSAAPISQDYIDAIGDALTTLLPSDTSTAPRERLSPEDRERVLIGLLASRGERLNLAIHLYYALGLGITPQEIVHILLLAGIYTGLPTFANSLDVAKDAFDVLANLPAGSLVPVAVLTSLAKEFDLPPSP